MSGVGKADTCKTDDLAPHETFIHPQVPLAEIGGRFVGGFLRGDVGLCRQGFGFKRVAAAKICGSQGMTGKADRASGWRGL
ncbi:hypothetical protein [Nitrosospira sp. NRS527]|uniref:hypothetical protein n=1 Tax=Nitrosospira sp. NRS527 TaxID=155925 RepID=UPI001AF40A6F|nr:hypothetical protein [Nitrosospira sp. NRS527]BCT69535.1 hypothetical protein NNRS527_03160 [Nitrosospira sp. NRS527]